MYFFETLTEVQFHRASICIVKANAWMLSNTKEYALPEQQVVIVHELEPHIMECIHDVNGHYVGSYTISNAVSLFRCWVLRCALKHLPEVMTAALIEELQASALLLMQNQFGNYIIQFVIEHAKTQDSATFVNKLHGQLLIMAQHKFASNVCEKALTFAYPETCRQLIDEILSPKSEGVVILSMMKDQYANYVLQKAIHVADADQQEVLINQIHPRLFILLQKTGYIKQLVS
ncbi:armadillo-type protein, partial [Lentinula lateritia]